MDKKLLFLAVVIIAAIFVANYKFKGTEKSVLNEEEAKTKVADYINNNLMQPGTSAEIKGISTEGDLYKVDISTNGQEITTYMTKDGTKFFPSVMDMNQKREVAQAAEAPAQEIPKSEKPRVELFVMSYCPYGTQIEKGILPVLENLGDKIDFKLRFVDYAMHDKKELYENLREFCIQKNEPEKLKAYLACFLKKGEGTEEACLKETEVKADIISTCVGSADKEFKVTENYNDKNTWKGQFPAFDIDKAANEQYGVQGSPTLVINGATAKSARDPKSLLAAICNGFETAPEECQKELSSDTPAPGFGAGTAVAGKDANCGS